MIRQTNSVELSGTITKGLELENNLYGEDFYGFGLTCYRNSGVADIVKCRISNRCVSSSTLERLLEEGVGLYVEIKGRYSSYNKHVSDNKARLILSVFVDSIDIVDNGSFDEDRNQVHFEGYICKNPVFRKTPKGREICDITLAVNRAYGKSDYIPVIFWGRNARFISDCKVSDKLEVYGRIQSREYDKHFEDGTVDKRTAFEVSAYRVSLIEEASEGVEKDVEEE